MPKSKAPLIDRLQGTAQLLRQMADMERGARKRSSREIAYLLEEAVMFIMGVEARAKLGMPDVDPGAWVYDRKSREIRPRRNR